MEKIERKMIKVWLIRQILYLLFLLAGYLAIGFNIEAIYQLPYFISVGIVLFVLVVIGLIFPFLCYRAYLYSFDIERIQISQGVIFKRRVIVPICQIQDLHIYEGPIMRMFGLSDVVISTAGSNYRIVGLTKDNAMKMTTAMQEYLEKRLEAHEKI